jgi:soluble lytic murein transglycosylase-like protein
MFVSGTARSYGLRVDAARDDRLDPAKETHAAVKLLSDLYVEFGDWALAIAAYNQGAQTVRLAIRAEGTRDAWTLIERGALNSYLPKVMAAALLLEDPSLGD